jgi:hypothetical protein
MVIYMLTVDRYTCRQCLSLSNDAEGYRLGMQRKLHAGYIGLRVRSELA